jgi:UV DNA damage repair endonuclease
LYLAFVIFLVSVHVKRLYRWVEAFQVTIMSFQILFIVVHIIQAVLSSLSKTLKAILLKQLGKAINLALLRITSFSEQYEVLDSLKHAVCKRRVRVLIAYNSRTLRTRIRYSIRFDSSA